MKVIFLDFDGVLNSEQSFNFWSHKRDQKKWETEMYEQWKGTLYEYLAFEFCPIACSNVEELMRRVPDAKIVVSSTWRLNNDVPVLKEILKPFKLITDAIIDVTPNIRITPRGAEIQAWLDKHPEVTEFVILDDDSDMLHLTDHFVHTSGLHGFLFGDMLKALKILKVQDKYTGSSYDPTRLD
jgi:hypothetical protein